MTRVIEILRNPFASMTGYFFVLLTIGMSVSALFSLYVAEQVRQRDFQLLRLSNVISSAADIVARLEADPENAQRMLEHNRIVGAFKASEEIVIAKRDPDLEQALMRRFGANSRPIAGQVPVYLCFPMRGRNADSEAGLAAGFANVSDPDCWLVRFYDKSGTRRSLGLGLTQIRLPSSGSFQPTYLVLILISSGLLALFVARFATAPLRSLAKATERFSISLDPDPLPESGPSEVRTALRNFNLMQRRVQDGIRERSQLLAAISHDLQTPLTRLRLRLEHLTDPTTKAKMTQDVLAMQTLIQEGLDLAQSVDTTEEIQLVDIDSLLESLALDAQEVGLPVHYTTPNKGAEAFVRVNALTRCLGNLIDNAVEYGGSADIGCTIQKRDVRIWIRDHGPGIASDEIGSMFQLFTRGAPSQPGGRIGTGMGLTIARAQAATFGAEVTLENHPNGGIIATIDIPVVDDMGRLARLGTKSPGRSAKWG